MADSFKTECKYQLSVGKLANTWPSCLKRRKLNELVSGQIVNCSYKYNTIFTGSFAEKKMSSCCKCKCKRYLHFFSAKILVYKPYLMFKVLTEQSVN